MMNVSWVDIIAILLFVVCLFLLIFLKGNNRLFAIIPFIFSAFTFFADRYSKPPTPHVNPTPATSYVVTFGVVGSNGAITAKKNGEIIYSGAHVEQGSNIVFTAIPDKGYRVKEWTGGDRDGLDNTCTISGLGASATINVEFVLASVPPPPTTFYIVTFGVVGSNGAITATVDGKRINSGANVVQGSNIIFAAIPDKGYHVKEWTGDGVGLGNTRTISVLNESANINVEFELDIKLFPVIGLWKLTGKQLNYNLKADLEIDRIEGYKFSGCFYWYLEEKYLGREEFDGEYNSRDKTVILRGGEITANSTLEKGTVYKSSLDSNGYDFILGTFGPPGSGFSLKRGTWVAKLVK